MSGYSLVLLQFPREEHNPWISLYWVILITLRVYVVQKKKREGGNEGKQEGNKHVCLLTKTRLAAGKWSDSKGSK